jgi:hypothetical protein
MALRSSTALNSTITRHLSRLRHTLAHTEHSSRWPIPNPNPTCCPSFPGDTHLHPIFPRDTYQLPVLEPHDLGDWKATCITLQHQRLPSHA